MALDARILLAGVAPKPMDFNGALDTFTKAYTIASTLKNKGDYGTIAQLYGKQGEGFDNPDTLKQAYDINPIVTEKFVAMKDKQNKLLLDGMDRKIRMQETAQKGRYYQAQEGKLKRETDEAERVNSAKPFQAINDSLHGMARSGASTDNITNTLRGPLENLLIEHAYRSVNDVDPETGQPMAKPQGTLSLDELDTLGNPNDWNAQDVNTITSLYGSNAMSPDKRAGLAIQQQNADSNRANVNSQIGDRSFDNRMDGAKLRQNADIENARLGLKRDEIINDNTQRGLDRDSRETQARLHRDAYGQRNDNYVDNAIKIENAKEHARELFESRKDILKRDQTNQDLIATKNNLDQLKRFTITRGGFSAFEAMPLLRRMGESIGIKSDAMTGIEPLVTQIAGKLSRATDSQPTQQLIESFKQSILDPAADAKTIIDNLDRMMNAVDDEIYHNKYIINNVNGGKTLSESLSGTQTGMTQDGRTARVYDTGQVTQKNNKVYQDKNGNPYIMLPNGTLKPVRAR